MQIRKIRDEKHAIQNEQAASLDLRKRIDELTDFLKGQTCEMTEYDWQFVKTLIEKITVYGNQFVVEFKYGIKIQID
ncbi:MAG: hypothetical protein K8R73_08935 [Clostridiales bacterium]|nr:hypothetical protein [Clostridiales bacterium]